MRRWKIWKSVDARGKSENGGGESDGELHFSVDDSVGLDCLVGGVGCVKTGIEVRLQNKTGLLFEKLLMRMMIIL